MFVEYFAIYGRAKNPTLSDTPMATNIAPASLEKLYSTLDLVTSSILMKRKSKGDWMKPNSVKIAKYFTKRLSSFNSSLSRMSCKFLPVLGIVVELSLSIASWFFSKSCKLILETFSRNSSRLFASDRLASWLFK